MDHPVCLHYNRVTIIQRFPFFQYSQARENAEKDYRRLQTALALEYGIVYTGSEPPSDIALTDEEGSDDYLQKDKEGTATKESIVDQNVPDDPNKRTSESIEDISLSDDDVIPHHLEKIEHPKKQLETNKEQTAPKEVIVPKRSVDSDQNIEVFLRDFGKERHTKEQIEKPPKVIAEPNDLKSKYGNDLKSRLPVGIKDVVHLPHEKGKRKEERIEKEIITIERPVAKQVQPVLEPKYDDSSEEGDDEMEDSADESSRLLGDDYGKKSSLGYVVDRESVYGNLDESSGDDHFQGIEKIDDGQSRFSNSDEEKLCISYDVLAKLPEFAREEILRKIRNNESLNETEIFVLEKEYKRQGRKPVSFRRKQRDRKSPEIDDSHMAGTRKKQKQTRNNSRPQSEESREIIHVLPYKRSVFGSEHCHLKPHHWTQHHHHHHHY